MRTHILAAISFAVLLSGTAEAGEAHWFGEGRQAEADGATSTWPMALDISSDGSGRVAYPSFACSGTLEKLDSIDGVARYRETISKGADVCVSGGTVMLQPRGDLLVWTWTGENTDTPDMVAAAMLRRAP